MSNKSDHDFQSAFDSFVEGCKAITEKHSQTQKYNLKPAEWRVDAGRKRFRVVLDGSAHCFVDISTGDVLKPASWAMPAKHARGNIYDESNGLKFMGPFGPAYLR